MKNILYILFLMLSTVLSACVKNNSLHQKIQPAKVDKPADSKSTPKLTLTPEARNRLGIASQPFPTDQTGQKLVPVSALLYDTQGTAWVFVETRPAEFHREKIQVLRTQRSQIQLRADFEDSLPIVIQGAAELNGAESGVGK